MTNLAAFQLYFEDESIGTLILTSNDISTTGVDDNELASAYGMVELLKRPDWTQGKTSEKLSAIAATTMRADAKRIFFKYGVDFPLDYDTPKVDSYKW